MTFDGDVLHIDELQHAKLAQRFPWIADRNAVYLEMDAWYFLAKRRVKKPGLAALHWMNKIPKPNGHQTPQECAAARHEVFELVKERIDSGVPLERCKDLTCYFTDHMWEQIKSYAAERANGG